MSHGPASELVVSLRWLGVDPGTGSEPIKLPKMAAQHNNGPPHLIATWPAGNNMLGLLKPGTVKKWDISTWGNILLD